MVSTNVAETSITIDDVVYVVDSGKHKEMMYHAESSLAALEDAWVSRASARQRRGRAGRVQPGACFHLFRYECSTQKVEHSHVVKKDAIVFGTLLSVTLLAWRLT